MKEIWKDVVGYEQYKISNLGRLKVYCKKSGKEIIRKQRNHKGYRVVNLSKDGVKTSYLVHRLVAQSFIHNPLNLNIVRHIDRNKSNNNSNNLLYGTSQDNSIDRYTDELLIRDLKERISYLENELNKREGKN